jgi:hypothetical protein
MSIINRRNAVLGWAVWLTAKKTASMKARRASGGGPNVPLVAATFAGVAGAVGALAFWRKQHSGDATA